MKARRMMNVTTLFFLTEFLFIELCERLTKLSISNGLIANPPKTALFILNQKIDSMEMSTIQIGKDCLFNTKNFVRKIFRARTEVRALTTKVAKRILFPLLYSDILCFI